MQSVSVILVRNTYFSYYGDYLINGERIIAYVTTFISSNSKTLININCNNRNGDSSSLAHSMKHQIIIV